eukprot:62673-Chlamydomonas_euryale.AAC.1
MISTSGCGSRRLSDVCVWLPSSLFRMLADSPPHGARFRTSSTDTSRFTVKPVDSSNCTCCTRSAGHVPPDVPSPSGRASGPRRD